MAVRQLGHDLEQLRTDGRMRRRRRARPLVKLERAKCRHLKKVLSQEGATEIGPLSRLGVHEAPIRKAAEEADLENAAADVGGAEVRLVGRGEKLLHDGAMRWFDGRRRWQGKELHMAVRADGVEEGVQASGALRVVGGRTTIMSWTAPETACCSR